MAEPFLVEWLPNPTENPLWTAIERLLKPAARAGGVNVHEPGDWVWVVHNDGLLFAAAVTRIGEEAELVLLGGAKMDEWLDEFERTICAWAKDGGAKDITLRGRKGWGRFASRYGWAFRGEDNGQMIYGKGL